MSAGAAEGKVGMVAVEGGEVVVEKRPRESSGQVDRRYMNCEGCERHLWVVVEARSCLLENRIYKRMKNGTTKDETKKGISSW